MLASCTCVLPQASVALPIKPTLNRMSGQPLSQLAMTGVLLVKKHHHRSRPKRTAATPPTTLAFCGSAAALAWSDVTSGLAAMVARMLAPLPPPPPPLPPPLADSSEPRPSASP